MAFIINKIKDLCIGSYAVMLSVTSGNKLSLILCTVSGNTETVFYNMCFIYTSIFHMDF